MYSAASLFKISQSPLHQMSACNSDLAFLCYRTPKCLLIYFGLTSFLFSATSHFYTHLHFLDQLLSLGRHQKIIELVSKRILR